MGFTLHLSVLSLILLTTNSFVKSDFVTRRNLHRECRLISELKRMDCGYGGINRNECFAQGCCFIPTPTKFIPWCFYLNQTYADPQITTTLAFRETTYKTPDPTSPRNFPTTTPTTKPSSKGKQLPLWLRKLLKISGNNKETTTQVPTKPTITTTTQNSMTLVIEDELRCQNTHRLYKKVVGNERCEILPENRIPCVSGNLYRERGESECSACTKLKCCYDPIMKKPNGRIAPHCFKPVTETSNTTPETTLPTSSQGMSRNPLSIWPNQSPTQQPGNIVGINSVTQPSRNMQRFLNNYPVQQQINNPMFNVNSFSGATGTKGFTDLLKSMQNGGMSNLVPTVSQTNSVSLPNLYNSISPVNNPVASGTSTNFNSALSLLNRPQSLNSAGTGSNSIMNLLSLINKPKTSTTQPFNVGSNTGSSTNALLSLLQKPKTGTKSSITDLIASMYNKPTTTKTASSSADYLSNIMSLLNKPKTSNVGSSSSSSTSGQSSTSKLTNIISSMYGNTASSSGTTSSSLSNIQNILSLLKRPTPATDFENKALPSTTSAPTTAATSNSLLNIISAITSSKSGNSPYASLLSSLGKTPANVGTTTSPLNNYLLNLYSPSNSGSQSTLNSALSNLLSSLLSNKKPTTVNNNNINTVKTPVVKPTLKPVPHKPEVDAGIIPILYENETRIVPEKTCYPQNCGHRATDRQITARIVGGHWTGGIAFWPWMASLRRTFYDDDRYTHICGATLISRRWIVTAGHCFVSYQKRGVKIVGEKEEIPSVYAVHLGKYYRDSAEPSMQVFEIESFEAHPEYDFKELKHDIAVARLKEPVRYTNYVQPACLPNQQDTLSPREIAWVTGWGETLRVGDQNKSKLKELFLPLISSDKCRQSWPKHFDEAWICTVGAFQEDACAGDSGGPLVKQGDDKRWDLVGVAIAGTRACSTDKNDIKPGIYTKVAYYKDFIDVATDGACDDNLKQL